uniref:Reverse transcriptase domain-containing protein n=1 Tax=Tanacetum cinerariifolium TaxID=118510 RepID=A0A6L2MC68_TANCI|nr:reverse transcriptase domain-containing protein [Tanacetum cinerariifolium]
MDEIRSDDDDDHPVRFNYRFTNTSSDTAVLRSDIHEQTSSTTSSVSDSSRVIVSTENFVCRGKNLGCGTSCKDNEDGCKDRDSPPLVQKLVERQIKSVVVAAVAAVAGCGGDGRLAKSDSAPDTLSRWSPHRSTFHDIISQISHLANNPNDLPNLQEQIFNHTSSLKALVQLHNESPTGLVRPIWVSFDDEERPEEKHDEEPEDLRKPYKEVLKKANETLPDFNERWTEEMSYISDVPVVMQISSFMSNSKCPELARRFSDQVPKTVTEMMKMVDDFVKSKEVFKNTELPKGDHPEKATATQFKGSRPPRHSYGSGPPRTDAYHKRDHYQPYVPPRAPDIRYDNRRHDHRRQEVNHLRLESLTKLPNGILPTKLQLRLPPYPPTVASSKKENLDRYCEYHDEKGHYTNDCFHLKKQLEMALESEKLNHLIKDLRQIGNNQGRQTGNNNGRGKVINMVHENGKDLKRKSPYKQNEDWMSVPNTFLSVHANDVLDNPLIVEAEAEGYWVRRVFVDQGLQELREISSTVHAMLKFPTPKGMATMCAQSEPVYECRWSKKTAEQETTKEKVEEHKAPGPEGEEKILVNPAFPDQAITIATQFSAKCREQLIRLLKDNMDVFAWQSSDMAGVPRRLIKHALNDMIMDIAETFDNLRKINMKLNPMKCAFGVGEGKFFGYVVTSEGIRANPKKMKAIADMKSPKTLKEMQSLSGKLAALNRPGP